MKRSHTLHGKHSFEITSVHFISGFSPTPANDRFLIRNLISRECNNNEQTITSFKLILLLHFHSIEVGEETSFFSSSLNGSHQPVISSIHSLHLRLNGWSNVFATTSSAALYLSVTQQWTQQRTIPADHLNSTLGREWGAEGMKEKTKTCGITTLICTFVVDKQEELNWTERVVPNRKRYEWTANPATPLLIVPFSAGVY